VWQTVKQCYLNQVLTLGVLYMGIFHVTRFLSGFFVRKTFGYNLEMIVSVHNVEIGLTGTGLIAQADLRKRFEEI